MRYDSTREIQYNGRYGPGGSTRLNCTGTKVLHVLFSFRSNIHYKIVLGTAQARVIIRIGEAHG